MYQDIPNHGVWVIVLQGNSVRVSKHVSISKVKIEAYTSSSTLLAHHSCEHNSE